MAKEGLGFSLEIPDKFLEDAKLADLKIAKLAFTSSQASEKIVDAFMQMSTMGVQPFLEKLEAANKQMGSKSLATFASGMLSIGSETENATSKITSLINKINQIDGSKIGGFGDSGKNIAELTKEIEKIDKVLKSSKSGLGESAQQDLVNTRERYKLELREQQKSEEAKIAAINKRVETETKASEKVAEVEAKNNNTRLNNLAKEVAEYEKAQNKKKELQAKAEDDLRKFAEDRIKRDEQAAKQQQINSEKLSKAEQSRIENIAKQEEANRKEKAAANEKMLRDAERITKETERQAGASRKTQSGTYEGAMKSSESANTISQRVAAINNLKRARQDLDTTTDSGKRKLQDLNKAILENERANKKAVEGSNELKKAHNSIMSTTDQLQRKLGLLFSVSQIQGYVMNMIKVRGEFELQNRALQAILQNKDEADKLFGRITELAVRSPFQVKELVTYTKQLAAYRVETEKLYDTTKMLADVSAGLGVDMSRLILAYGQVKSANYLRGTELRQFSEAGINILGELATYYTELEGRMVSVGDVQERVTKRMVAFGDVEEVFKRITSAGGIFYNMQEIQAETLAGQMSNLRDSIDIMFNAIGKANDAGLKNAVGSVRELVENWREIAFVMKQVIAAFAAYKGATTLATIGNSAFTKSVFSAYSNLWIYSKAMVQARDNTVRGSIANGLWTKSLAGVKTAATAAWAGIRSIVGVAAPLLLIGGMFELYRQTTAASRAAEVLKNNLDGIIGEDTTNLDKQVDGYDNLISRLKLANEGSKERKDIIEAIKSGYGQYLNFIVDEKTSIEQLTTAYDDVVKSMKAKAAASTLEKGYMAIEESYASDITEARKELEKELSKGITVEGRPFIPTKQEIQDIFNLIQTEVANTDASLLQTSVQQRNFIQSIVQDYIGQGAVLSQDYTQLVGVVSLAVTKKEQELELEKNINSAYKETLKSRDANIAMYQLEIKLAGDKKKIDKTSGLSDSDRTKELKKIQEQFELDKIELKFKFGEISEAEKNKQKDSIINWATTTVASINEKIKSDPIVLSFGEDKMASLLINRAEQDAGISATIENTISGYKAQTSIIDEQLRLKNAGLKIDEEILANALTQQSLYERRAGILGVELNAIKKINEATVQSVNAQLPEEYWISIVDQQKSLETVISETNKKYNDSARTIELLNHQKAIGLIISEADLKKAEEAEKNYKETLRLLEPKKKKTTSSSKEDPMKARVSIIKEAGKAYEEYLKYYDKEISKKKTQESYKDAFKAAEIGDMAFSMDFDVSGVIAGLETLLKSAVGETRKTIEKELANLRSKVEIDVVIADTEKINKQFEDMFAGYELTIEMGKLGLDKETTAQIFNVDIFDTKQIRKRLEEMKAADKAAGTERLEEYTKIEHKITDMEQKERLERLKEYSFYLKKSMSERVSIELEGQKKIAEIPKEFTAPLREQAKQTIRKETSQKLDKQDWKDFQESDMYITLFEDLDRVSTATLDVMREKLLSLKNSLKELSPTELKEIVNQVQKIGEQTEARNPFKKLIPNIKEYISYLKVKKDLDQQFKAESEKESGIRIQNKALQTSLAFAKSEYSIAVDKYGIDSSQARLAEVKVRSYEAMVSASDEELKTQGDITKKLLEQIKHGETLKDKLSGAFQLAGVWANELSSGIGDVASSMENIFGTMDAKTADVISSMQDILGGVGEMASGIGRVLANPADIGGWIQGISGLVKTIGSIFAIGDKKKEREIQREMKLVEDLEKKYKKLEKAIDNAYSLDTFKSSNEAAKQNLQDRIDATERAIAAEEGKKKSDSEAIEKMRAETEEYKEALIELEEQRISSLGGFGSEADYKSAAEEFANAWYEAYKETGDGLSGLEDTFDSFMDNIIKKQLLLRGTQKLLDPLLDLINDVVYDGIVDMEEQDAIDKKWEEETKPALDALYQMVTEQMGVIGGAADAGLDGLQRGIQAITEPTAQAIEALLNSMRFFVADSNLQLKSLYLAFSGGNIETNPILGELRAQSIMISSINKLMNSVVGNGHPKGQSGIRVFID